MAALKTLLFSILVPGAVTVLVPYWLLAGGYARFAFQLGGGRYLGLPLVLLGAALYGWCAWHFAFTGQGTPAPIDPPKTLVAEGPYRHVRNPMYVAVLTVLAGEVVFFEAPALLVYTALVFGAFFLIVVGYEEPTLRRSFGAAYRRYCQTVPRWLPRWLFFRRR